MADCQNTTILIVDDREEGLVTLEAALSELPCQLIRARSGQEALRYVLEQDFAVIVLDVQMPEMDGFTTAEYIRMRAKSRHIPIIFVTAINKDEHYVFRGYESGAVDYIFKPFDAYILKSKIKVFLDLHLKNLEIKRQAALLQETERDIRSRELVQRDLDSLQRYRNLSEAIPHVVWQADVDGRITYINERWTALTGQSKEQSLCDGWFDRLNPNDIMQLKNDWAVARSGGHSFESEVRILTLDEKFKWMALRGVPEFNANGQLTGWIGTNTDIDDRKKAEESMWNAKIIAESANQTKSEFLANMSHEIRTPLGAILGFSELLLNPDIGPEERDLYGKTIARNGQQLTRLIDEILDLSKVESGLFEVECRQCNLSEITADIFSLLAAVAEKKHIELLFSAQDTVPEIIETDLVRFKQVLLNIVGNAIKFTYKGSVKVEFSVEKDASPKVPLLAVRVMDTGIGIPKHLQGKLFQPFVQADNSVQRKFGGTGLGLALSRQIANALGGNLELEISEPNVGSTFKITVASAVSAQMI